MIENPFETQAEAYDAWYDENANVFESELLALRAVLPPPGTWIEVGVGTGRFAERLGIQRGVEPSGGMAHLARNRGVQVIRGRAEALPLDSESVDAVFFITSLCFVENLEVSLNETVRVLRPGGSCVIGLLPADSPLGQEIKTSASVDAFFRYATLHTVDEIVRSLAEVGLSLRQTTSTLCGLASSFNDAIQLPNSEEADGSFVAIRAEKPIVSC